MYSLRGLTIGLVGLTGLFLLSNSSVAAPLQCNLITCDCSSLATSSLQSACEQREQTLMQQCGDSAGKKVGYCAAHGAGATRVSLVLDPLKIGESTISTRKFKEAVTSARWSLEDYIDSSQHVPTDNPKLARIYAKKLAGSIEAYHYLVARQYDQLASDDIDDAVELVEDEIDIALERLRTLDASITSLQPADQSKTFYYFLLLKARADTVEHIAKLYSIIENGQRSHQYYTQAAQGALDAYSFVLDEHQGLARSEIRLAIGRFNAAIGEADRANDERAAMALVAQRDAEQAQAIAKLAAAR